MLRKTPKLDVKEQTRSWEGLAQISFRGFMSGPLSKAGVSRAGRASTARLNSGLLQSRQQLGAGRLQLLQLIEVCGHLHVPPPSDTRRSFVHTLQQMRNDAGYCRQARCILQRNGDA